MCPRMSFKPEYAKDIKTVDVMIFRGQSEISWATGVNGRQTSSQLMSNTTRGYTNSKQSASSKRLAILWSTSTEAIEPGQVRIFLLTVGSCERRGDSSFDDNQGESSSLGWMTLLRMVTQKSFGVTFRSLSRFQECSTLIDRVKFVEIQGCPTYAFDSSPGQFLCQYHAPSPQDHE